MSIYILYETLNEAFDIVRWMTEHDILYDDDSSQVTSIYAYRILWWKYKLCVGSILTGDKKNRIFFNANVICILKFKVECISVVTFRILQRANNNNVYISFNYYRSESNLNIRISTHSQQTIWIIQANWTLNSN